MRGQYPCVSISKLTVRRSKMELANLEKLADELIELRSDTFSLGNVYEYLLRVYETVAGYADKTVAP